MVEPFPLSYNNNNNNNNNNNHQQQQRTQSQSEAINSPSLQLYAAVGLFRSPGSSTSASSALRELDSSSISSVKDENLEISKPNTSDSKAVASLVVNPLSTTETETDREQPQQQAHILSHDNTHQEMFDENECLSPVASRQSALSFNPTYGSHPLTLQAAQQSALYGQTDEDGTMNIARSVGFQAPQQQQQQHQRASLPPAMSAAHSYVSNKAGNFQVDMKQDMHEHSDEDFIVHEAEHDHSDHRGCKRPRVMQLRVSWEERLKMLVDYKQKHGNLLIPIRYKENPSLGKFVHNTREQYKLYNKNKGEVCKKKCSLTAERIQQLNDIGFVWSTDRAKRQEEDWNERLEQLKRYKEVHGDCLVPHGYPEDPTFAEWIHRQRTTYVNLCHHPDGGSNSSSNNNNNRHSHGPTSNQLLQERMKKLIDIGFNFTVHSDKWMDYWEMLRDYKERNGK
jgi:Helicase associated domain